MVVATGYRLTVGVHALTLADPADDRALRRQSVLLGDRECESVILATREQVLIRDTGSAQRSHNFDGDIDAHATCRRDVGKVGDQTVTYVDHRGRAEGSDDRADGVGRLRPSRRLNQDA